MDTVELRSQKPCLDKILAIMTLALQSELYSLFHVAEISYNTPCFSPAILGRGANASLTISPKPTIQIVAQEATPMRGTTPLKNPVGPDVFQIYVVVFHMVGDSGLDGLAFNDCISIRTTSNGWFQHDRAPPNVDAAIFSPKLSFVLSSFPFNCLITPSANREMPMREDHPVICRSATALTPLFTPRIPFVRTISKNVCIVPGTLTPACALFVRVTSTVFMQVVTPMVRYAWDAPPTMPPRTPATLLLAPRWRLE